MKRNITPMQKLHAKLTAASPEAASRIGPIHARAAETLTIFPRAKEADPLLTVRAKLSHTAPPCAPMAATLKNASSQLKAMKKGGRRK